MVEVEGVVEEGGRKEEEGEGALEDLANGTKRVEEVEVLGATEVEVDCWMGILEGVAVLEGEGLVNGIKRGKIK